MWPGQTTAFGEHQKSFCINAQDALICFQLALHYAWGAVNAMVPLGAVHLLRPRDKVQ